MLKEAIPSAQRVNQPTLSTTKNTASIISDLKELFKAIVLISNVVPVFAGFWLALFFTGESFSDHWGDFLFTIIGSTFVMAGALVINNWYDVDIDTIMERTKKRPTVTGNISLNVVLTIGISLTVLGFILLLLTTVESAFYAFIGWFTYVILYTMWSKRRYTLNTVIGSVSGAVTPLIGWTAIEPQLHLVPIIMFLILFIWQMPHTFVIAIRKYNEYKAAKVAMLPVVHGLEITKRQIFIYNLCLLPLPFYLTSLGTTFIVLATLLNIVWIVLSVAGFFMKDHQKWAYMLFLYSVNYITIMFIMMVIVTLPIFN